MEVGSTIDFHSVDGTSDYNARLQATTDKFFFTDTIEIQNTTGNYLLVPYNYGIKSYLKNGTSTDFILFVDSSDRTHVSYQNRPIYLDGKVTLSQGIVGSGSGLTNLNASQLTDGTVAIARGGTGATSVAGARVNLLYQSAPITSTANDTVTKWGQQGPGLFWYSTASQLTGQPSQYGLLLSMTTGGSEVHQLWAAQSNGSLYHRGGNSAGWGSTTWMTVLDSSNYTSYAAAKNHTHSYLPLSGGTLTGPTYIQNSYFRIKSTNLPAWSTATSVTAAVGTGRLVFSNNSNQEIVHLYGGIEADNKQIVRLDTRRTNGSNSYYNYLNLKVGPTGAYSVALGAAAAWRNALGLGNTTGAVPVANGGTGTTAKGRTLLSNIGITSGTAAAPSSGTNGTIYIQYS